MSQLPAVEVEDLPGLVKYIISTAGTANAEQVRQQLPKYPNRVLNH
jgi:hypothetical protein